MSSEDAARRAQPDVSLVRFLQEQARAAGEVADALTAMSHEAPALLARPVVDRPGGIDGEAVPAAEARERVRSWIEAAERTVEGCHVEAWASYGTPERLGLLNDTVARGVRWRGIYPLEAWRRAPEILLQRAECGEEIRLLREMPYRLFLVDDRALVRVNDPEVSRQRILTREPALRDGLAAWFEEMWTRAVRLEDADAAGAGKDTVREALLAGLARGERDEDIAQSLDMSVRTVRRRVAELMTELGATSRFQAGIRAAQRGWL